MHVGAKSGLLIAVFLTATLSADEFQFFESKIRPVLASKCYGCHSPKAEKIKGDFLLDTRAGIRKGGASKRDAVIPGDIAGSQLIEAIRYGNEKLQMPPDGKLSDVVIADFEKWIGMGAPDPRDGVSKLPREIVAENHWAWKNPKRRPAPDVRDKNWVRDPLDQFVLARLEKEGDAAQSGGGSEDTHPSCDAGACGIAAVRGGHSRVRQ